MAEGLRVRVKIAGVDEIKRAFRRMSDEAKTELKRASEEIATDLAAKIRVAAVASSAQSALMAGTVKAAKGMVPIITAGGSARVGRNLKPAHKILFGAEFGAHTLRQFRPFTGNDGYWFFRTIRDNEQEISDKYNDAADRITRQFGSDA